MSEKQEETTNTEPTVESTPAQEGEDSLNPNGSKQNGDDDQDEEEKEKEVP